MKNNRKEKKSNFKFKYTGNYLSIKNWNPIF